MILYHGSPVGEKEYVFHGSHISGITELEARSKLHSTGEDVVYLTGSIPYSLVYMWDDERNQYEGKFVTCALNNGIVRYEEVFPNQLQILYQGVSGYLYCVEKTENIHRFSERESMYYCTGNVSVDRTIFIKDVYEAMLRYEREGLFQLARYDELSEKRREEIVLKYAVTILGEKMQGADSKKARFYRKHFVDAWRLAEEEAENGLCRIRTYLLEMISRLELKTNEDHPMAQFIRKHFPQVWEEA